MGSVYEHDYMTIPDCGRKQRSIPHRKRSVQAVKELKKEMLDAAKNLEFEKAAEIRDRFLNWKRRSLKFNLS